MLFFLTNTLMGRQRGNMGICYGLSGSSSSCPVYYQVDSLFMRCSLVPAQREGPGFDSGLDLDWVSSSPVTTGMDTVGGLEGEKRDYQHFLGFLCYQGDV